MENQQHCIILLIRAYVHTCIRDRYCSRLPASTSAPAVNKRSTRMLRYKKYRGQQMSFFTRWLRRQHTYGVRWCVALHFDAQTTKNNFKSLYFIYACNSLIEPLKSKEKLKNPAKLRMFDASGSDIKTRLIHSSDAKIAAAARRVFGTSFNEHSSTEPPAPVSCMHGFHISSSDIPFDIQEAASAVAMLAPKKRLNAIDGTNGGIVLELNIGQSRSKSIPSSLNEAAASLKAKNPVERIVRRYVVLFYILFVH